MPKKMITVEVDRELLDALRKEATLFMGEKYAKYTTFMAEVLVEESIRSEICNLRKENSKKQGA